MAYKRVYQRKVISFYLTPELVAMIDAEARRTGENRSEIMRRIIQKELDHQKTTEYEHAINESAS